MALQWNNIEKQKPVLFDWLVFTLSLLLGLLFPSLSNLVNNSFFSGMVLAGLVLYTAGSWLKHGPLHRRLAVQGRPQSLPYTFFLVIGHWVIMLFALFLAEEAFRSLFGLPGLNDNDPARGLPVFIAIVVSGLLTWLVFRTGSKKLADRSAKGLAQQEWAGDLLLLSAVSFFSYVFWESSLLGAIGHMDMSGFGSIILQFGFLSFAYLLFYLPLRYLYLLEDNSGGAWKRLLIIFLLLLFRGLLVSVSH